MPFFDLRAARRIGTAVLVAAVLPACAPSHAAFLRVPVVIDAAHPGGLAIVRMPLDSLRERLDGFDAKRAAYFFRGRETIARAYEDTDDDGQLDQVIVKIPADGTEHWIVVVSPGPTSDAPLPEGGSATGVRADFTKASK